MACSDQLKLSNFIKSTHERLRKTSTFLGAEEAWKKHCEDEENLTKYAYAMQELATNYWEKNSNDIASKAVSRNEWIYCSCREYFFEGLILKHRCKEKNIAKKINVNLHENLGNHIAQIKLLDVGSCYNPLKVYEEFSVTAIDIAPANKNVYKCDFLNVKISDTNVIKNEQILGLQENSFHGVVFSLVLEYLPCPTQRFKFCKQAYDLLISEGVLIIITPDSKHANANVKLINSWRYHLSQLGFAKVRQEKLPHINCMIYRKSLNPVIPQRWAKLHERYKHYDMIMIPQDFKDINDDEKSEQLQQNSVLNTNETLLLFNELPCM